MFCFNVFRLWDTVTPEHCRDFVQTHLSPCVCSSIPVGGSSALLSWMPAAAKQLEEDDEEATAVSPLPVEKRI